MPADGIRAWLREHGEHGGAELLGKGYQAWAYLHRTPLGDVVVKRAHPAPVLGMFGRLVLRHEQRVYERLRGVPGVPRSFGLVDPNRLALEHIPGKSLRHGQDGLKHRARFFEKLRETIETMHRAGVAHGDLKRKDNILVGRDEQPCLIDFGVARLERENDSWFGRWLHGWYRQLDYNAWIKLKYQRRADEISAEDKLMHRPLILEWIARVLRPPWHAITLRRLRKRLKERRSAHV